MKVQRICCLGCSPRDAKSSSNKNPFRGQKLLFTSTEGRALGKKKKSKNLFLIFDFTDYSFSKIIIIHHDACLCICAQLRPSVSEWLTVAQMARGQKSKRQKENRRQKNKEHIMIRK